MRDRQCGWEAVADPPQVLPLLIRLPQHFLVLSTCELQCSIRLWRPLNFNNLRTYRTLLPCQPFSARTSQVRWTLIALTTPSQGQKPLTYAAFSGGKLTALIGVAGKPCVHIVPLPGAIRGHALQRPYFSTQSTAVPLQCFYWRFSLTLRSGGSELVSTELSSSANLQKRKSRDQNLGSTSSTWEEASSASASASSTPRAARSLCYLPQ